VSNTKDFPFNPAQLSTWEQARELARKLSEGPVLVGGGVLPETGDPKTSGLYVPEWLGGPAQFPEPSRVDSEGNKHFFIHFRFRNGAEGMNAGLVADRFRRYPTSPAYVLRSLADEAALLAGEQQ
jgi:hypothetical protein